MADMVAGRMSAAAGRTPSEPRRGFVLQLPHRVWLWTGLMIGVAASIMPAALVAQPGRVALLKLGVATVLTMLPGWLYALYLDRRGVSLYDEFVLNLFRLHIDGYANLPMPPKHTSYFTQWKEQHDALRTDSTDNLYRRRFEGIYGRQAVSTRAAFDPETPLSQVETFSPVLLATLFIGVGWALTLQPELLFNLNFLTGVQLSGRPVVPVQALQFAFIGAYAFVLQDLVRRYFVVDLRNTAYVAAISRITFVTLIVAVAYAGDQDLSSAELGTAFVVGFIPRAALEALQARTLRPVARVLQGRRNERLLAELDGMDIWQESRLVELGIENLQQFVTADLVEVLLRSRTPVERLVDWLDRAFLLLLLPAPRSAREAPLERLRTIGIRYATDLERAYNSGSEQSRAAVAAALGMSPDGIAVAVGSLQHQHNYWHVAAFRRGAWLRDPVTAAPATP